MVKITQGITTTMCVDTDISKLKMNKLKELKNFLFIKDYNTQIKRYGNNVFLKTYCNN